MELHAVFRDEASRVPMFLDQLEAVPPIVRLHAIVMRQIVDVAGDETAIAELAVSPDPRVLKR